MNEKTVGFFLTWLHRLLTDLSVSPTLPIPIHSDSQAALHIARNPVFHERTKNVELDCHFVRQQFSAGLISLNFVPSSSQLADIFTKPLSGPSHSRCLCKLGLSSVPSNLKGGVGFSSNIVDEEQGIFKKNREAVESDSNEMKTRRCISSRRTDGTISSFGLESVGINPSPTPA